MKILGTLQNKDARGPRPLSVLLLVIAATLVFAWAPMTHAQGSEVADDEFLELSLDELMNIEITSVSKTAEKKSEAAAAIFVLTQEDIRRSGATNIPDALRLVPGVNVAQIDSSKWSITVRGSAGRFANKLLVLIDGRSIYTPFFSGVYWEANDVMLEDVDRIEVIRGPGGTLWGSNAVNGVINIVTKRAEDTQGGLLTVGAGTEERGFGALRYGGKIKDDAHYRFYAKYFNRDEGGEFATGESADDDWQAGQGGFRVDWNASDRDRLTVQGDIVDLDQGQILELQFFTAPTARNIDTRADYRGRNILARWNRTLSDTSELQLQLYYDYYRRTDDSLSERRRTVDVEFQHSFEAGSRHQIVWGADVRYTKDDIDNSPFIQFMPDSQSDEIFSVFLQDAISLTEKLKLTLGTKVEYNSFSGFEYQPSGRLAWTPNERHTLWGSVSRAVRVPSRAEQDVHILSLVLPGPTAVVLQGTDNFDAEDLLAFELGYRVSPADRLALDIALFYNDYDNYRSLELGALFVATDPPPAHTAIPFFANNNGKGSVFGVEVAADWRPYSWWLIHGSYAFQEVEISFPVTDLISETSEGDTPQQQAVLLNRFDLPHDIEIDATLRYTDRLSTLGVDDYLELDLRLAWQPREDLEIALIGRNLLDHEHFEFAPTFVTQVPSGVERSFYAKVTWKF